MLDTAIAAILGGIIMIAVRAFALPIVRFSVEIWLRLYTAIVPKTERESRGMEVRSGWHAHIEYLKEEGYRPDQIALHFLIARVRGSWDDLTWSLPHFPSMLAERLENGSKALGRTKISSRVVSAIAVLSMMHLLFVQDEDIPLPLVSVVGLAFVVIYFNQERRWAQRTMQFWVYGTIFLVAIAGMWVVLEYRLYEAPAFPDAVPQDVVLQEVALQTAVAILPIILGIAVRGATSRTRIFKGHRWLVAAPWGLVFVTPLGIAMYMNLTNVIMVWTALAIAIVMLIVLALVLLAASAALCYAGLKGSASVMRLTATGIRRLT